MLDRPFHMRASFVCLVLTICTTVTPAWPYPQEAETSNQSESGKTEALPELSTSAPLTAIGDVHGDLRAVVRLLLRLGLIDARGHWSGGKRHVVQTGDLLDRGADSRHVAALFRSVQREAAREGGQVVVLLGNHEVMNLVGDWRWVTQAEYVDWAAIEDPALRDRRKRSLLARVSDGNSLLRSTYYTELGRALTVETFDQYFPPGYFARLEAFAPTGSIGSWLLELPVVHIEHSTLFVHGGLSPGLTGLDARSVHRIGSEELRTYLKTIESLEKDGIFDSALGYTQLFVLIQAEKALGGPHESLRERFATLERIRDYGLLFAEEGPVWYRGLATGSEHRLSRTVRKLLERHAVERIVIGHTQPASLEIEDRFARRVFLIDTGMNHEFFGGTPSALLFPRAGDPMPFALEEGLELLHGSTSERKER